MSSPNRPARDYWDEIYNTKGAEQVSWFQPEPVVSLELIDSLRLDPSRPLIDVGGGASPLAGRLLQRGYTDLTVLDVSACALALTQRGLGSRAEQVHWETADLLSWTPPPRRFALWHDRALFHFLTDPRERARYRELVTAVIAPGGYLIVATFAADGPKRCSGSPVARYRPSDLVGQFGAGFRTVTTRREHHRTPASVDQPFTWLMARRDDQM
jgi:hypothetical protein